MDKQRMSNILSSVQMSPRDRKDFIEELSKLGQNGAGGEGGEVSTEHPVKIIELTQEELMTGKELDITVEEYLKYTYINIKIKSTNIEFIYNCSYQESDLGHTYNYDEYILRDRTAHIQNNFIITLSYDISNLNDTIYVQPLNYFSAYGDINFVLSNSKATNLAVLNSAKSDRNYSVILFTGNDFVNDVIKGTYYNGTFTAFADGKIQVYDVNTNTGKISEKLSIDIETLAGLEARIAALESA